MSIEQSRTQIRLDTSLELMLERTPNDRADKVLATVVSTAGSTYRKAGARMLIMANGSLRGLLSGGCFEADLKLHADQVLRCGMARVVEYEMRNSDDDVFGLGTGCEGAMRVLLEPAGPGTRATASMAAAGRATHAGLSTSLVVIYDSTQLPLGTYTAEPPLGTNLIEAAEISVQSAASQDLYCEFDGRSTRAFIQFLAPPPHLLICGAGPDVQPVANMALGLGWRVTIVDHRPAYAEPDQFAGAVVLLSDPSRLREAVDVERCHAAVIMSHHLPSDSAYLRELSKSDAPYYVGLLGPAARRDRLVVKLGPSAKRLWSRLHSPVGLSLGAVTPEGIALAIVGEIHAWLSDCKGTITLAAGSARKEQAKVDCALEPASRAACRRRGPHLASQR